MLSNGDLERLIAEKRCEIEKEKIVLGLSAPADVCQLQDIESKQDDDTQPRRIRKTVTIKDSRACQDVAKDQEENKAEIPPELERYIRRYLGLPVMLKAGEYSPNNPLVRAERGGGGDVLLGLGEYERRRNTLRKIRQQQYREYLDQQAKKKQEAKEQAERERREREEKERQREEERERARQQIEQQKIEAEQRRYRLIDENVERERVRQKEAEEQRRCHQENVEEQRRASVCYVPVTSSTNVTSGSRNKVDTGVQVGISKPLSVGVQTDDAELYRVSPSPTKSQLTQAERELSPRTVDDYEQRLRQHYDKTAYNNNKPAYHNDKPAYYNDKPAHNSDKPAYHNDKPAYHNDKPAYHNDKPAYNNDKPAYSSDKPVYHNDKPAYHNDRSTYDDDRPIQPAAWAGGEWGEEGKKEQRSARRRSYGDFDERTSAIARKPSRERLLADLRHSYMPSIFDADAIQMRNQQAEKEAMERRQFYQQELRNQILEQQRIREERKTREKLLEAAERRRLEEQLRMLRAAQQREVHAQRDIDHKMRESAMDYERKRTTLQKEIEDEQQNLLHSRTQRKPASSHSDTNIKLPTFYNREKRLPFSTNISETSIFNPNYDVDSYLRKNLNPKKETLMSKLDIPESCERNVIIEKALVHEKPKERPRDREKSKYEPTFLKNLDDIEDETPIPVLRHSPKTTGSVIVEENVNNSDGMKLVENKWKVPAVQKNILKNLPKEDGKNVSILTQLGSIRRQLQLEQLRLDNLMSKSD